MLDADTRAGTTGRRARSWRRALLGMAAAGLVLLLWSCLAAPVEELWPPRAGEPAYAVDIVYWDWHTFIIEPRPERGPTFVVGGGPSRAEEDAGGGFREWGFAEEAWYLRGRQGSGGALRALFWPSGSAVAAIELGRPYWERFPERKVLHWTFVVSEEGLARMRRYLEAHRGPPIAGYPGWYEGERSYHLFYLCHHFTADALREAGLPIRPWWAFAGWMTRIQLNRIERYHADAGFLAEEIRAARKTRVRKP